MRKVLFLIPLAVLAIVPCPAAAFDPYHEDLADWESDRRADLRVEDALRKADDDRAFMQALSPAEPEVRPAPLYAPRSFDPLNEGGSDFDF